MLVKLLSGLLSAVTSIALATGSSDAPVTDKAKALAKNFFVGVMYGEGEGVHQDEVEAVRWFRPAADHGVAAAQFNMGVAYAGGWGAPQDEVLAYMWFNLAAARSPQGEELRERAVAERDELAAGLSRNQRARGQKLACHWQPSVAATCRAKPVPRRARAPSKSKP